MDTTGQAADVLSAYIFKRKSAPASSSSEQTNVSPGTSMRATIPQSTPRVRPPYGISSTSEGASTQRIWIPSNRRLLEEVDMKHNQSVSEDENPGLSGDKRNDSVLEAPAAAVHELKNDGSRSPTLSSLRSLLLPPEPLSLTSALSPKERMKWTRSQSGGILIRKQRAAREVSSSDNATPRKLPGIVIMPLVPPTPLSRSDLSTYKKSSVRVEDPFPEITEIRRSIDQESNLPPADSLTEKIPIETRKLLPAPIVALRRFVKTKSHDSKVQLTYYPDTLNSSIELQSHKSNLKRHQTIQMLNKVSSLLRESGRIPRLRRNLGTVGSDQARSHQGVQRRGTAATFISKNKSIGESEATGTATSSIRKLQLGSTPLNSVLGTATYKVKRSPSQDTEEFFAIDISIRGGTNYLPSEARRIHTPPLPDDNVINNIQKQDHLFDYYPCNSTKASNSSSQQNNIETAVLKRRASQDIDDKLGPVSSTPSSLSLQNPSSRRRTLSLSQTKSQGLCSQEINAVEREKSSEWLKASTIDMDALVADTGMSLSQLIPPYPTPLEEPRSEYHRVKKLAAREQQYLHQLDWTIPEHLPSSPLCPRHPRY